MTEQDDLSDMKSEVSDLTPINDFSPTNYFSQPKIREYDLKSPNLIF